MQNAHPAESGKLLEVGSGPGTVLEKQLRTAGIDAQGIEPSDAAYEYSITKYGVNVQTDDLGRFLKRRTIHLITYTAHWFLSIYWIRFNL